MSIHKKLNAHAIVIKNMNMSQNYLLHINICMHTLIFVVTNVLNFPNMDLLGNEVISINRQGNPSHAEGICVISTICNWDKFSTIGDWDDLPLIFFSKKGIRIWEDGRIAWRDYKKPGNANYKYYYRTIISKDDIKKTIESLEKEYNKITPYERHYITIVTSPMAIAPTSSSMVLSKKHFKNDLWNNSYINRYLEVRDKFLTANEHELCELMKTFANNSTHTSNSQSGILLRYHELYCETVDNNSRYFMTNSDIIGYAKQFIADAEYFLLLEKLVISLLPKDENLISERVQIKRKFLKVDRYQINSKILFDYKIRP